MVPLQIPDTRATFASLRPDPVPTYEDYQKGQLEIQETLAKQKQLKQDEADKETIRRITLESNGDWEVIIPKLRRVAPALAMKYEGELTKMRKEGADAMKVELDNDLAELTNGLRRLQMVAPDGSNYSQIRALLGRENPELAQLLPEQHDPTTLQALIQGGQTQQEFIKQNFDSMKFLAEGKHREGAALALSAARTPEEWAETMAGLATYTPKSVLREFGEWTPDGKAPERAAQLGMSPDVRADNAREDAQRAFEQGPKFGLDVATQGANQRYQEGMLGVARRNAATNERQETRQANESGKEKGTSGSDADAVMRAKLYIAGDHTVFQGLTPSFSQKVGNEILRLGGHLPEQLKIGVAASDRLARYTTLEGVAKSILDAPESDWDVIGPFLKTQRMEMIDRFSGNLTPGQRRMVVLINQFKGDLRNLLSGQNVTPYEGQATDRWLPNEFDRGETIAVKLKEFLRQTPARRQAIIEIARGNLGQGAPGQAAPPRRIKVDVNGNPIP